jgi:calcium-dependent protein kinase
MAAMNQEKLLSMNKIEQAFKIFDQDGDGFISKQEMKQVMGDIQDNVWTQILFEADNNQDGLISYQEFKQLLLAK